MSPSNPQAEPLIAAGLSSQVILPDDPKYAVRQAAYFDDGAKLPAACFVQPRSAAEVATVVKTLADAKQPFAIRSGGYTVRAGSSNINGGVTIDLGLLNSVEYDASTETAHLGPGATWYVEIILSPLTPYHPISLLHASAFFPAHPPLITATG